MTAVEWLVEKLNNKIDYIPIKHWDYLREIIQQALEMEKKQHEITWEKSGNGNYQNISFEKYYSETYKKDK